MSYQPDEPRIMHIILDLERAGAQEALLVWNKHFVKNNGRVVVCALRDGPLRSEIEQQGIKVEIPAPPPYNDVFLLGFFTRLYHYRREFLRLIKTHRINIIQTHLLEFFDFLTPTLRRHTPLEGIFWTIQNVDFLPLVRNRWRQKIKQALYIFLYRLATRKVNGLIAVSDQVRQAIIDQIKAPDHKIITIYNSVDSERFEVTGNKAALCQQLNIPTDARLIITVGRLTEQKGQRYLIEAAKIVTVACPRAYFLFVGKGGLKNSLRLQAQEVGVEDKIRFLGVRKDIPELLAAADIFTLPSLWEGLSLALLEAMAAARPIVATAVSGTVQAIIPNETGLLVPSTDAQSLAQAILFLLSNPDQAAAMGQNAKKYVQRNFSAQKQAEKHLALYQRVLAKPVHIEQNDE